jgi:hypothetical protein
MKKLLVVLTFGVFVCLSSMVLANEASAPLALQKGKLGVGLSIGYGSTGSMYDEDGKSQDVGGTISTLPINLTAGYGIIDGLEAGVDLSLVRNAFSPDSGDSASGFGLREVTIGAKYAIIPELAVGAGFLLDVGTSEDELEAADELATSDGFHGIAIAVTGKKAFDKVVVGGGLRYTLLLSRSYDIDIGMGSPVSADVNPGDILDLTVSGGYQILDNLYAGLSIMFTKQITDTEIEASGQSVTQDAVFQVLSLGIDAVYDINDTISAYLSISEKDEYFTIGIPLMGKDAPAIGFPLVTVGVKATLL